MSDDGPSKYSGLESEVLSVDRSSSCRQDAGPRKFKAVQKEHVNKLTHFDHIVP